MQVPGDQAKFIILFYLNVKAISSAHISVPKKECKEHNVPFNNKSKKEDLAKALGRALFEKKVIVRVDVDLLEKHVFLRIKTNLHGATLAYYCCMQLAYAIHTTRIVLCNSSQKLLHATKNKLQDFETCFKALLHCNFLGNLSRNAVARQVAGELHSVTWVVSQFFLLHEALHEVELSSTFRNGLQQLTIPSHSVSPLQQFVSQF